MADAAVKTKRAAITATPKISEQLPSNRLPLTLNRKLGTLDPYNAAAGDRANNICISYAV